jgi:hypothetical protein
MGSRASGFVLAVVCVAFVRNAGADEDELGTAPLDLSSHESGLVLEGWAGGGEGAVVDAKKEGLIAMGFTGLYHYGLLDVGLGVSGRGALFGYGSTLLSLLAGLKFDLPYRVRIELLAEGGDDIISGVGSDLFSKTRGDDGAAFLYAGGRTGVALMLGGNERFLLGLWLAGGKDWGRETIHPQVSGFLGGYESETHTVGGPSYTLGLRFGGELGVPARAHR